MIRTPWDLPADDLADSVAAGRADLEVLRGRRVLITGGTGFLGSWLVASLLAADASLDLDLTLTLVTRQPASVPLPSSRRLRLVAGDVRTLKLNESFDVIVHGAASSGARYGEGDGEPRAMARTIVEGTEAILEIASLSAARMLFLSSGAVYGPQIEPVSELCLTGPDSMDPRSAYGEAKRLAETLCAAATDAGEVDAVIARLFSFVGPRLPREVHFAAGNFLAEAVNSQPITARGDGRPLRAYLYAGDLPEWCWALIARGTPGRAYNVGGEPPITIADLANRIASLSKSPLEVQILGAATPGPAPCYVPVIARAATELGLTPRTSLESALRKTFDWYVGHH